MLIQQNILKAENKPNNKIVLVVLGNIANHDVRIYNPHCGWTGWKHPITSRYVPAGQYLNDQGNLVVMPLQSGNSVYPPEYSRPRTILFMDYPFSVDLPSRYITQECSVDTKPHQRQIRRKFLGMSV